MNLPFNLLERVSSFSALWPAFGASPRDLERQEATRYKPGGSEVTDDNETILVSRNKVPGDVVDRLLRSDGNIWMPEDNRYWPHPKHLAWHRENIFGQMVAEGSAPWE